MLEIDKWPRNPANLSPGRGKSKRIAITEIDFNQKPIKHTTGQHQINRFDADRVAAPQNGHSIQIAVSGENGHNYLEKISSPEESPWWKSGIIKLIGSFLVGIGCLSLVAVAVMIRNDASMRNVQNQPVIMSPSSGGPTLSKRSTSSIANTFSVISTAAPPLGASTPPHTIDRIDRASKLMLKSTANTTPNAYSLSQPLTSNSAHVPVPIQVIIDPKLIGSSETKVVNLRSIYENGMLTQPESQSSDVDTKETKVPADYARNLLSSTNIEQSKLIDTSDTFNRYIIEMDIKVRKSA